MTTETAETEQTPEPTTAPGQLPSVGRIVHYRLNGSAAPLAALITAVPDDPREDSPVSLVVYREHLQFFRKKIPFSATPKDNHWSWPPRV